MKEVEIKTEFIKLDQLLKWAGMVGDASEGLQRDWPVVGTGVDKHYGYAFQWFGLCGLMALLYVWFQIVRRFIRPRRQPAA